MPFPILYFRFSNIRKYLKCYFDFSVIFFLTSMTVFTSKAVPRLKEATDFDLKQISQQQTGLNLENDNVQFKLENASFGISFCIGWFLVLMEISISVFRGILISRVKKLKTDTVKVALGNSTFTYNGKQYSIFTIV